MRRCLYYTKLCTAGQGGATPTTPAGHSVTLPRRWKAGDRQKELLSGEAITGGGQQAGSVAPV